MGRLHALAASESNAAGEKSSKRELPGQAIAFAKRDVAEYL